MTQVGAISAIRSNALNCYAGLALAKCFAQADDIENALKHIEFAIRSNDVQIVKELVILKIRITPIWIHRQGQK